MAEVMHPNRASAAASGWIPMTLTVRAGFAACASRAPAHGSGSPHRSKPSLINRIEAGASVGSAAAACPIARPIGEYPDGITSSAAASRDSGSNGASAASSVTSRQPRSCSLVLGPVPVPYTSIPTEASAGRPDRMPDSCRRAWSIRSPWASSSFMDPEASRITISGARPEDAPGGAPGAVGVGVGVGVGVDVAGDVLVSACARPAGTGPATTSTAAVTTAPRPASRRLGTGTRGTGSPWQVARREGTDSAGSTPVPEPGDVAWAP